MVIKKKEKRKRITLFLRCPHSFNNAKSKHYRKIQILRCFRFRCVKRFLNEFYFRCYNYVTHSFTSSSII